MHLVPVLQLREVQQQPDQVAGHDHCVVVAVVVDRVAAVLVLVAVGIDTIHCTVDFDPKIGTDF